MKPPTAEVVKECCQFVLNGLMVVMSIAVEMMSSLSHSSSMANRALYKRKKSVSQQVSFFVVYTKSIQ